MVPILMVVLLLVVPAWAQEQIKIGFVDLQKAISLSKEGRKARAKLEARLKDVEANLLKEQKKMEKLKAEMEKKRLLLNTEQKKNLERELQRRHRDYKRVMADANEEMRLREREARDGFLQGIEKAMAEVGKKEKFTLIVTRDQLLYVDQSIDITKKVVDLYDRNIVGVSVKTK